MSSPGQIDFNEMLRRRRMAELRYQQGQSDQDLPDIEQPQPQSPDQSRPNLNALLPYSAPQEPAASTAAREAYSKFLQQPQPDISQYHPSTGRRVAATILGGLAGAGGRPEAGRQFLYEPFTRQQSQYNATGERLKEAAGQEEKGEKETATVTELKKRGEAETERAGAEHSRAGAEEERRRQLAEPTPDISKDLYDLELPDGNKVRGAHFVVPQFGPDKGSGYYVGPDGAKFGEKAVKSAVKQAPEATGKFTNAIQASIYEFVQSHGGRLPNQDEMTEIVKNNAVASGLYEQREAATALSKTRKAQIEAIIKPATPQEIETARREQARDPNSYWKYLQSLPPVARRGVELAVPPQVYLTGGQEDRLGNANVTLWHVETLRDMLKDPFIKENLGPIIGRINLADSTWGGNDVGSNPEDVQKEQAFLSFLTSNLLWETTSGVGTRPARQTIELIKRTAPRGSETIERIIGALEAEEKSAKNVQKGLVTGGPPEKKPGDFSDIKEVQ